MFDLIVIVAVGLIAYTWAARGFFSSFINLLCVLVSGTVALAVWEPLAMALISADGGSNGFLLDISWAAGLALPFAATLALTRVATNKIIPANLDFDTVGNHVGGAVCGLVSGVLTVGLVILAAGYTRTGPSFLGMGYRPIDYVTDGSLVRKPRMILPADSLTASFFSSLSEGLFRPMGGESLARWHPDWADEGTLLRTNFDDGKSRNALGPGGFDVTGYYLYQPKDPKQLFADSFDKRVQSYTRLDGTTGPASGSDIVGMVVRFRAGAKEKSGRVVVGASQIRLVAQTDPNDPTSTIAVQPVALISQADASKPALGRWRFDSKDIFVSSVGGRDDAPMAFEFPVPKGCVPIALYVKGLRQDLTDSKFAKPFATYTSMSERDGAVRSATIAPGSSVGKLDRSSAAKFKFNPNDFSGTQPLRFDASLPDGVVLAKDNVKGLVIGAENAIEGGELSKFSNDDINNRGMDRALAVRGFAQSEDTEMVQIKVDRSNTVFGLLAEAASGADRSQPPVLIDNNGAPYSPVGFVYKDTAELWIYFNPQQPVRMVEGDLIPTMSRNKPNQELTLIYRVSKNVKITGFAIGEKVIAEFVPPIEVGAGR